MAVLTVRIICAGLQIGGVLMTWKFFKAPSFSVVHNAAQNKNAAQTLQSMILPLLCLSQINKIIFGPVACLLVDTDRPP